MNKIDRLDRSWAVFPLQANSKIPFPGSRGVKDAAADEHNIDCMFGPKDGANVGLATGLASGVVVLDIDVKNGHDGFASLKAAGIELPKTLAATTPSGGMHLYFRMPEGEDVRNAANLNGMDGVDVRGTGGYVLLPPSRVDGKAYSWEDAQTPIAPFPQALRKRDSTPAPAAPARIPETDVVERARLYLRSCDPAISGQGGHNALLHAASSLVVGFNMDDETALRLLTEEYNPRCVPPWSEKELRHKLTSARSTSSKAAGHLLEEGGKDDELERLGALIVDSLLKADESKRKAREQAAAAEATSRISRGKPLSDFADPLPDAENPLTLFRNGWLRKGGGVMFISVSGAGKSVASTQCSMCWALGRPWMGITPVRPLKIDVYQWEDDEDEVADFRNNVKAGLVDEGWTESECEVAASTIFYHNVVGLAGDDFIAYLRAAQLERKADLVILNPLQSFAGCDISKNAELSALLRVKIDPILNCPDAPCGCMIVHHTNKVPQNAKDRNAWLDVTSAAYAGAGGAELVNWARAILVLRPHEKAQGYYDLIAAKRGKRLGWTGDDDKPTTVKTIAHSEGIMYWREASKAEAAEAGANLSPSDSAELDARRRETALKVIEDAGGRFASQRLYQVALSKAGVGGETTAKKIVKALVEEGVLAVASTGVGASKEIRLARRAQEPAAPAPVRQHPDDDEEREEWWKRM